MPDPPPPPGPAAPAFEPVPAASPRRRARRRLARAAIAAAALLALALAPSACASTVTPPPAPSDPAEVFLRYEARHRGLILPAPGGGFVEYGYGDFDWYALRRNRWYHVFDTVLWPTLSALGRRRLEPAPSGRPHVEPPSRVVPIAVEAARALALERDLDREFERARDGLVHNAAYGLDFVPAERPFWGFYNCNDAVADWLETLGCEVSWALVRTDLEVD